MRFLLDECTGPAVAQWLRDQSHDVFSVYDQARGWDDDQVLNKAFAEDWILITNDKDFGEKVYRERRRHQGVVLLRLEDERAPNKIEVLRRLLLSYSSLLGNRFVVVTEERVRFGRIF
jgi:predicted nuclease of predicted toxin-antitoxin system